MKNIFTNLIEEIGKKKFIAIAVALVLVIAVAIAITIALTGGNAECDHAYDNDCDAVCGQCGETREVGAHDYNDASCTTPKTCKICGVTDGEALGHATEEDDGNCLTPIVCPRCNEILTVARNEHEANADDGDCATPVRCTACDTVMVEAKAHDFEGEWKSDADGHWHVCENENCSVTDTKTAHNEGADGKCIQCGKVLTPIHQHAWGSASYEWNAEHTACVATRVCTLDETHVESENGAVTSDVTKPATCVAKGETTYSATFTNTAFTTQSETIEDIPENASLHNYEPPTIEWNADHSDCEVKRRCTIGDHTDTLTKTVKNESDGAKTVTAYDENGLDIAIWVYKPKTSGDGYYLYKSEIELPNSIEVKTYDEEGNLLSERHRLIFEGYAPDSDDSEFGD